MRLPKFLAAISSDQTPSEPQALPRSIRLFTYASLVGASITLIISLLDLGYLSFWLNPSAAVYSLIYHVGFILIGHRKRIPDNPSYFSTAIFSGYLLSLIWLAAFISTIVALATHNGDHQIGQLRQQGLPATIHSQRVQVVLALYEMVVIGAMAVKGHSIVIRDGPDPPDWRYQQRLNSDPEAAMNPPMMSVTETVIAAL